MPEEYGLLKDQPSPLVTCPRCGATPFEPFLRGQVQRRKRFLGFLWKRDYVTVICRGCKGVVGHESPPGWR